MKLVTLKTENTPEVLALFCRCFSADPYYVKMFPDAATRENAMADAFSESVTWCLRQGMSMGVRQGSSLVAFILCLDYRRMDRAAFRMIFSAGTEEVPYRQTFHDRVRALPGDIVYSLSIAVDPSFRRRGLASGLLDQVLRRYPHRHFVSDVSNTDSLSMYRTRDFQITELDKDYHLVIRAPGELVPSFQIGQTVRLLLPGTDTLTAHQIPFRVLREDTSVFGYRRERQFGIDCFCEAPGSICPASLTELSYGDYLRYQRLINVSQYTEHLHHDCALYALTVPYTEPPLYNDILREMLPQRPTEWSLIPDVYVSVPVSYDDADLLFSHRTTADAKAAALLRDLDFRTHYEAGVPSSASGVDDLACFKQRIDRIYLGKLRLRIASEATVDRYDTLGDTIGAPALVDVYLSVDRKSGCGVLTWYSLSSPFLLSHLMDNVIRNQVTVLSEGQWINLYDYLKSRFSLTKRGTPKIYVVLPNDRTCLKTSQIASLLASETIYPEQEEYGQIIDPEILQIAASEHGMGQYDRAFICAYTNVMLQFSPDLKATLRDRMCESSIALFYIELILFEEAAIGIADRHMVELFTSAAMEDPVDFLRQVDRINDSYTNTVDFWDVQVNYPTSQRSMRMLRSAFRIEEKLEALRRDQDQLQTVFDTKCDIIDRQEAKRMERSLAVLSVLAIFSAWIDGHDYLATWTDLLPPLLIQILQKALFAAILIIGITTAIRLFGAQRKRKKRK